MSQTAKMTGDTKDLYFMNAKADGKPCWYYVKVDRLKLPIFRHVWSLGKEVNIEEYGKIVASGWGEGPTPEEKAEIEGTEHEDASTEGDYVIYLLNAQDKFGTPVYYYVAVDLQNVEVFDQKMSNPEFDVAEYGIILLSGYGAPSKEEQEMMEKEYGFSHARFENPDAEIPFYES